MHLRNRLLAATTAAALTMGLIAPAASAGQPVEANNQPQLYGTTYTLQNYFNAAGDLIPFFDEYSDRIGPKTEIPNGFIYDIDFTQTSITMDWNTDPEWDIYEPYVAALAGLTQEQAAQAPLADEYWITFSKPISDLTFTADPSMPLVPNTRIVDDYTLVISVPGGTSIGDGFNAVINIER